jgi:hypothetical protein
MANHTKRRPLGDLATIRPTMVDPAVYRPFCDKCKEGDRLIRDVLEEFMRRYTAGEITLDL